MSNQKYEITNIAHTQYPFLHRIRALRDIGEKVKAGDLGGFVESESNLSTEDDASWIFDDAISAGNSFVDKDACLSENAVACDSAYISEQAEVSGEARIEAQAYVRGSVVRGHATGCWPISMVRSWPAHTARTASNSLPGTGASTVKGYMTNTSSAEITRAPSRTSPPAPA